MTDFDVTQSFAAMEEIAQKADFAGRYAVDAMTVVPMVVGSETYLFSGEIDYHKPTYFIEDGPCGFAWVEVFPKYKGNTKLGKNERAILGRLGFKKDYTGKIYSLWISAYNQSLQRKEAYARAYASVLSANGVSAYCGSRMD